MILGGVTWVILVAIIYINSSQIQFQQFVTKLLKYYYEWNGAHIARLYSLKSANYLGELQDILGHALQKKRT